MDKIKLWLLSAFWAVVGLLVLLSIIVWLGVTFTDQKPGHTDPVAAPSPAQLRKEVVQRAINQGEANLIAWVKANMHDPDSFELVDDRAIDAGDHVTMVMTYRGKNGFNATRLERVGATFDLQGNITSVQKIE